MASDVMVGGCYGELCYGGWMQCWVMLWWVGAVVSGAMVSGRCGESCYGGRVLC